MNNWMNNRNDRPIPIGGWGILGDGASLSPFTMDYVSFLFNIHVGSNVDWYPVVVFPGFKCNIPCFIVTLFTEYSTIPCYIICSVTIISLTLFLRMTATPKARLMSQEKIPMITDDITMSLEVVPGLLLFASVGTKDQFELYFGNHPPTNKLCEKIVVMTRS